MSQIETVVLTGQNNTITPYAFNAIQGGNTRKGWKWGGWDPKGPAVFNVRVDAYMIPENVFSANLLRYIYRANNELARTTKKYINEHWSPTVPSAWGDPPAVRTGKLKGSARISGTSPTKKNPNSNAAVTLGYYRDYAGTMEVGRLHRPFMAPALKYLVDTGSVTKVYIKRLRQFKVPGLMRLRRITSLPPNASLGGKASQRWVAPGGSV